MMKQAFISSNMQDLWQSANNCAPGCGCQDDRFEMTFERVGEWKDSVAPEVCVSVLEDLKAIIRPDSDAEVLEGVQISTNIGFEDEVEARRWLEIWIVLLEGDRAGANRTVGRSWLDSTPLRFSKNSEANAPLLDLHITAPGVLFGSVDAQSWTRLADTPSDLKLSTDQAYRFVAAPGIFDEELESLAHLANAPGLVDLRLEECHSLTDKAIDAIVKLPTLQVLAIDSMQVLGTNLVKLAELPLLKRLDLSGCKNIPSSSQAELQLRAPGLAIFAPELK